MSEGSHSLIISNKRQLRNRALTLLSLLFIFLIVGYLIYWIAVLRFYEKTDNAYVAGNQIQIMAQVPGSVTQVHFDDTDLVNAGDTLVTLDDTDARQAYQRAKTELADSVRQIRQLMINSKQLQANIVLKRTELQRLQNDLQRREVLGATQSIGREELQHARDAVQGAQASLDVATQQYNANQAAILNTPLADQPLVQQAATRLRDAWLALQRTRIVSPVTGYISRRNVQVGSQVTKGAPLMAVIPAGQLWVDANLKETQLGNVFIGQPVTMVSDVYGGSVVYKGKVVGMDMGTGSAFSLLPAQNASGNWIKVVQRLPVRIALDPQQLQQHPLRIGLSMRISIDTKQRMGASLAEHRRQKPAYTSFALTSDLAPIEQVIQTIIQANAS